VNSCSWPFREVDINANTRDSGYTMAQVRIGRAATEFGLLGEGPTVILLPGRGGEGPDQYDELGPALGEAGYRAVAVNPRGVGRSSGQLANLSLHDLARDVATVIRALGGPAHLVGRALGNRVARCVAVDSPDLVKSVCLISAGGLVAPDRNQKPAKTVGQPRPLRYWRTAGDAHQHAAQTTPIGEWWSGGDAPMLVVQGLADRIAVPENGRRLAEDYADRVELLEIAEAGHRLLFDRPDIVIPAIVNFIDNIESGQRTDPPSPTQDE